MVKILKSAKGGILNNMRIVIDIPKEFEDHFRFDKFNDSLNRLRADAHCLAGNYEQELCDMLIEAFARSVFLPGGHGDLIDRNSALDDDGLCEFHRYDDYIKMRNYLKSVTAIIEADKEVEYEDSN